MTLIVHQLSVGFIISCYYYKADDDNDDDDDDNNNNNDDVRQVNVEQNIPLTKWLEASQLLILKQE